MFNAFVHRDAAFKLILDVFWKTDEERMKCAAFLAPWNEMVKPHWNGEACENSPSVHDPNYAAEYWAEASPKLQTIQAKYDPKNVLVFAQGIVGYASV